MRKVGLFSALLFGLLHVTAAHALTAVCKEPTGRALGVNGTVLGKGEPVDTPDGMTGGLFTIVWSPGQQHAQIISQGSGGGDPRTDTGILVFESEEQVSFLVMYRSAVWLYSLYKGPKLLLFTSHNNGFVLDSGGAIAKTFKASCDISEER